MFIVITLNLPSINKLKEISVITVFLKLILLCVLIIYLCNYHQILDKHLTKEELTQITTDPLFKNHNEILALALNFGLPQNFNASKLIKETILLRPTDAPWLKQSNKSTQIKSVFTSKRSLNTGLKFFIDVLKECMNLTMFSKPTTNEDRALDQQNLFLLSLRICDFEQLQKHMLIHQNDRNISVQHHFSILNRIISTSLMEDNPFYVVQTRPFLYNDIIRKGLDIENFLCQFEGYDAKDLTDSNQTKVIYNNTYYSNSNKKHSSDYRSKSYSEHRPKSYSSDYRPKHSDRRSSSDHKSKTHSKSYPKSPRTVTLNNAKKTINDKINPLKLGSQHQGKCYFFALKMCKNSDCGFEHQCIFEDGDHALEDCPRFKDK